MASPAPAFLDPPVGWQPHAFVTDLRLDAATNRMSLLLAVAFTVILFLGRALLPTIDRKRLHLHKLFFALFYLLIPARALVLSEGVEMYYGPLRLAGLVLLVWSIIGVAGLLLFDLAARRLGVPKILRDLTVIIASLVALVMILSRSGVNLLSIITTSAVVTAVIGLALQDTLGNLLSGVFLQLESSFAIGDWVRFDKDGQVGKVREIRWRSTVIETRNGDLVVIPNGFITKNQFTIYSKDGLENRRWVYFNVHLRHPPNVVIKTVIDAIGGIPNVSERTPPDCVLMSFEDSWAKYAVRYRLVDFRPDDPTDSAVRTRIWYALHRANIELPYPGFNVFMTQLDDARDQKKRAREKQRRLDAIARVPLFAPLDQTEREHLVDGIHYEVFGPGELILRAGAPGDSLYILRSGEVKVKIGFNGLEKELATLRAGDFFGEMSLMTGESRRANVVACSDVECYVIDKMLFQDLIAGNPSLVGAIGRLLHDRQVQLAGERAELGAEHLQRASQQDALLGRIKSFFGLGT